MRRSEDNPNTSIGNDTLNQNINDNESSSDEDDGAEES